MIQFRPYRNGDTHQLVDLWHTQPRQRGLTQPVSAELFEALVLAKPTFAREELILAEEGGQIVGFGHASLGMSPDLPESSQESSARLGQESSARLGVVRMLMVRPEHRHSTLPAELLGRCEDLLRREGATVLCSGGPCRFDPFYLGLYGGSHYSGILRSDEFLGEVFTSAGYQPARESLVLHRDLTQFRPIVDRRLLDCRRRTGLHTTVEPRPREWSEACAFCHFDRIRYELHTLGREVIATATFWNMDTFSASWGLHASGLVDLDVVPDERGRGMAKHLLNEALRQLGAEGISMVETQVDETNGPARSVFVSLGFQEVDRSVVYRRS